MTDADVPTSDGLLVDAVHNNAQWCDAVCRTHGISGRRDEDGWTWPVRTPPYYPDAVSLRPDASAAALLARVDTGPGCSVKDSFATLVLHDFEVIIEASWIGRRPTAPADAEGWEVVHPIDLPEWERAWGEPAGLFVPALLADATFVAARRDGRITAGAILCRTGAVVGVSNVFGGDWPGVVGIAARLFPGLCLVGYETGVDLAAARAAGFGILGPLRVWMRTDVGARAQPVRSDMVKIVPGSATAGP